MDAAGFSTREIQEAVRACAHLRVPDPVPPYFRRFLSLRVRQEDPTLASKLDELSPDRLADLFRLIRLLQQAARDD